MQLIYNIYRVERKMKTEKLILLVFLSQLWYLIKSKLYNKPAKNKRTIVYYSY